MIVWSFTKFANFVPALRADTRNTGNNGISHKKDTLI